MPAAERKTFAADRLKDILAQIANLIDGGTAVMIRKNEKWERVAFTVTESRPLARAIRKADVGSCFHSTIEKGHLLVCAREHDHKPPHRYIDVTPMGIRQ